MTTIELLTTKEAAKFLKVSQSAVKNWIRSGRLPALRLPGGQYRITREALLASLRASNAVEEVLERGSRQARQDSITEERIQEVFERVRGKS